MNHLPERLSKAKRHHRDDGSIANELQQQEEAACLTAGGRRPASKQRLKMEKPASADHVADVSAAACVADHGGTVVFGVDGWEILSDIE